MSLEMGIGVSSQADVFAAGQEAAEQVVSHLAEPSYRTGVCFFLDTVCGSPHAQGRPFHHRFGAPHRMHGRGWYHHVGSPAPFGHSHRI